MKLLCFYFQVHQPFRLKRYRFFDIGNDHNYFDDYQNRYILRRIAGKCYLPTNQILLDLIKEYGKKFKVCFSISGVALDQFEMFAPDVLESFQKLAATGCVEFLAETYSHSLSSLKSKDEFFSQVEAHSNKVERLFGQKPTVFRNTELIYSDYIGQMVAEMGYKAMLTEGAKHILGWKSNNYLYCNAINPKLKILLKNYQLSDDIAFRFSQQSWSEWPLTAEKYVSWLNSVNQKEEVVNLFMDYETFGEHQWPETGIFEFLKALPHKVFRDSKYIFCTPSEVAAKLQPVAQFNVPYPISWADEERDLTAWLGNELQNDAFNKLYELEDKVRKCGDAEIQRDWKYLQTSDHFYYMCTKWFADGDVHKYFNPFNSPYEAFINYMNILSDFKMRLDEFDAIETTIPKEIVKVAEEAKKIRKKPKSKRIVSTPRKHNNISKFEQITKVTDALIKKILKETDLKIVAKALKTTTVDIKNKFFFNLSKKSSTVLESKIKELKNLKKKDIAESQKHIIEVIKKHL
ncbi:MAG: FliG C-terminal domain-containing protein [Bacteroidales bacterium]|jgi:alpha-amylase